MSEQQERIAEIRELLAKMAPHPWQIVLETANGWDILGADGGSVAVEAWHGGLEHARHKDRFDADGKFIAQAPQIVSGLLDQLAESARVQAALRAQIEKWQQRADRHAERAANAEDVRNFDRQDSAAYATRLCAADLAALLAGQERS